MAGNDTAALVVALSAQVTKFEKDMQKAGSIADRQVSSIEDRFAQLNPTFSGLTALIPAAVVTGALASIKSVLDALAEVGDKSQDLRIPAQELQALSMGAQQARVSADELNKALTTFTDVSKRSSDDGKDFYKALQNIGGSFVEAFKNAPSQSERLRIASGRATGSMPKVRPSPGSFRMSVLTLRSPCWRFFAHIRLPRSSGRCQTKRCSGNGLRRSGLARFRLQAGQASHSP
jgi:hypothetical protein